MTQGKLRMFRRDRLFTSDKERLDNLQYSLKNVRIVDESAYFNSGTENASPSKGGRNRDGIPPAHKGAGKGDKGGGPGGAGAAGGGKGGGGYVNSLSDKTGSAAAQKGGYPDFHTYNNAARGGRQHGMSSIAQAMQDSMAVVGSNPKPTGKVITGLQDVIEKRSNSVKPKPKVISPPKGGY